MLLWLRKSSFLWLKRSLTLLWTSYPLIYSKVICGHFLGQKHRMTVLECWGWLYRHCENDLAEKQLLRSFTLSGDQRPWCFDSASNRLRIDILAGGLSPSNLPSYSFSTHLKWTFLSKTRGRRDWNCCPKSSRTWLGSSSLFYHSRRASLKSWGNANCSC